MPKFQKRLFIILICFISILIIITISCGRGKLEQSKAKETAMETAEEDEFIITNIEKNTATYSVELNKNLKINFIEINGNDVLLPANRDQKTNREFKYISADSKITERFLTKLRNEISEFSENENVVFSGEFKKILPEIVEVNVLQEPEQQTARKTKNTRRRRASVTKGYATIVSKQGLIITNILLKSDNDKILIEWPTAIINKRKYPVIEFLDSDNLKEINDLIINKYFEKVAVQPITK